MKKIYIIFATVLCLSFVGLSQGGISLWHSLKSGSWSPSGPSVYHK